MVCASEFESEKELVSLVCLKTVEGNLHCGILYKDLKEMRVKLFHYAWHITLRVDDTFEIYTKGTYRIPLQFDSNNILYKQKCEAFTRLLKAVYDNNQKTFKYSTVYNHNLKFPLNGKVGSACDKYGFTCATFIDTFLRTINVNLIDYGSWRLTDDDKRWRKDVFKKLIKWVEPHANLHEGMCEHIRQEMKKPYTPRLKPEELVGACEGDPLPADFEFCSEVGVEIAEELNT